MRQREDLVFSMAEYGRRLASLRRAMARRELEAMIVTIPENLCYLTGYQTPGYYWFQALVVPLEAEPFFVTRRLEDSNVQVRTWVSQSFPYDDFENPPLELAKRIEEQDLGKARIGYERHSYFFRASEQDTCMKALPDAEFVDAYGIIEQLRLVKSAEEIEVMRRAARTTEAGMQAGIDAISAGVTENDVAAEIQWAMTKAGSEYPAIAPFVASGWRGSIGHATWEGRRIEPNEAVFLEVGGCVARYHTAMMRTVFVGDAPEVVRRAEAVVRDAMDATMAAIKPGVPAQEVDRIARKVIREGAPDSAQASRTGYSIGLAFAPDWGEGHILSLLEGQEQPLEENMTFHLIPWVQVPGMAGVGLSETVRVTATGCESLFDFPRQVFIR